MEEGFRKRGDDCPQLLDLIPKERDWMVRDAGGGGGGRGFGASEEKKLELRLGPPGEDWSPIQEKIEEPSVLSCLGYFSKRGFLNTVESKPEGFQQHQQPEFLKLKAIAGSGKDSSLKTSRRSEQQQSLERKACCPQQAHAASGNAAGANNNSSQTRVSSVPVVGWPPVRSFRKNIASSSSKPSLISKNGGSEIGSKPENCSKGLFVKINMDGIPIGRKVDLKAYDSYEKLSSAVEELFRDLLAAQRDTPAAGTQISAEEKQAFTGLLDGSGEYTLVYEDNEGDRILVGDVPWKMFVSNVKRLRVLKSSELSALSLRAVSRKRTATEC